MNEPVTWRTCCAHVTDNASRPVQLCDLYENDCIFDKFDCCVNGDGTRMATGSYSNLFKVCDRLANGTSTSLLWRFGLGHAACSMLHAQQHERKMLGQEPPEMAHLLYHGPAL